MKRAAALDGEPAKRCCTHIYGSSSQSSTQSTGTRYIQHRDNGKGRLTQKRTNQQPITPPTPINTTDPDDEINQWVCDSEGSHEDASTTQAGTASTAHPKATKPKKTQRRLVCILCTYISSTMFTNEKYRKCCLNCLNSATRFLMSFYVTTAWETHSHLRYAVLAANTKALLSALTASLNIFVVGIALLKPTATYRCTG
jgi:hypothetical protein